MFVLSGDFYAGSYHPSSLHNEEMKKTCPGDYSKTLWETTFDYQAIEGCVDSASQAFNYWRSLKTETRIEFLYKYKQKVIEKADQIALAIAWETGKPLWEAKTEAAALSSKVDVTISDSLKRVENQVIKDVLPKIDGHTIFKPLGPCLIIGPFNFPCHLANTQILSALLTGNTIIFKPSEKTLYSAQVMFDCLVEAGFPKGVINFIRGGGHTSSELCKHPKIKGIFFTGSKEVGQKILDVTYKDLSKLVALELGGKNTSILHHDTPQEHALPELLRACFLTSGQRCTSTSIIAIHQKIADEFIGKFKELTERILIDHPVDYKKDPFMGPLIDEASLKKYNEICKAGESEGAQTVIKNLSLPQDYKGAYASPTIYQFDKINLQSSYLQTEIFGPNCTFIPYKEIEEAIEIANMTEYGLAASVFTQDKDIYHKCLVEVDSGLLNLNRSTVGASSKLPFGGVKSSGNHHPAAVSMIDSTVNMISSLETTDTSSSLDSVKGLQ